jgi:hypothetical protein
MSDLARDHLNRPMRSFREFALHQRCVRLTCRSRSCGHQAIFEAVCLWWLVERRNWPDDPTKLFSRFYCRRCWSLRLGKVFRPYWELTVDQPNATHLPPPPEREWKRLISRYRS